MSQLDPRAIFALIAAQIPRDLHDHLLIIGSLAAAYHYRSGLRIDTVNTKDADVVVQPAGAIAGLGARAGAGIRALLSNDEAFADAHFGVDVGLLRGYAVSITQLRAIAEQFFVDAIDPFVELTA